MNVQKPNKTPDLQPYKALGLLFSADPDQRELDTVALEWLCEALDNGYRTGDRWISGERWSAIMRRALSREYGTGKKTQRVIWINRHFYARQLAVNESGDATAKHIAKIWHKHGHHILPKSILSSAERKQAKTEALAWIDKSEKWIQKLRKPATVAIKSAFIYKGLEANIEQIAKELQPSKKVKRQTVI